MPSLHISKVAVGCDTLDALSSRQRARIRDGFVPVHTRFRPKRADDLLGGSLYWIMKHRFAARQTILGFDEDAAAAKTVIRLDPQLVRVEAQPRRAHQGWRYLSDDDAPPDIGDGAAMLEALPPRLAGELSALGLI